jgi:hypothetical protein
MATSPSRSNNFQPFVAIPIFLPQINRTSHSFPSLKKKTTNDHEPRRYRKRTTPSRFTKRQHKMAKPKTPQQTNQSSRGDHLLTFDSSHLDLPTREKSSCHPQNSGRYSKLVFHHISTRPAPLDDVETVHQLTYNSRHRQVDTIIFSQSTCLTYIQPHAKNHHAILRTLEATAFSSPIHHPSLSDKLRRTTWKLCTNSHTTPDTDKLRR